MTLCFIIENSKMWKTQRHKHYEMTIDTNSYEKTKKHKQLWKNKRQTIMKYQEVPFGLSLPTLPLKPKASSHQALSSMIGQECIDLL